MLNEWWEHIEFAYPWVLGFLILIPILIVEYNRRLNSSRAAMMVTTTHFIQHLKSVKTALSHLPFVFRIFALICLIIAMAMPRMKYVESHTEGEGISVVLCLDISGSMTARDFQPNRIEASKQVASEFVRQRPGDMIGLVIFSSVSYTLCPITTDHNALLAQIRNVQSGYLQEEGTAIGSGLATSVDRLRESPSKSKVVILLTDGVDVGGSVPPELAKQMAEKYNIKVYTIGMGSNREVEETVSGPMGTVTETRTFDFNEDLLKDIATSTGGQYFHATDNKALSEIYKSIDQLEKSKVNIVSYNRYTQKFLPWLLAAIAFMLIEMILRLTVFRKFP